MPALLAVAGVLLSFSLPPFGWWPLGLTVALPFLAAARAKTGRGAFFAGFWFGVPFFAVHLFWLPTSFAKLLSPAFWLVYPPLVLLVASFWGLTLLVAYVIAAGFRRRTKPTPGAFLLIAPFAWVITEQLRSFGYFGFPWGALGYAWLDTPVGQLAEFAGLPGLSLIMAGTAALIAATAQRRSALPALIAAALIGGAFFAGYRTGVAEEQRSTRDVEPRTALLIQGNLDPYSRAITAWSELNAHTTLTEEAISEHPEADLVIWPEGALSGHQLAGPGGRELREEITAGHDATFVIGGRHYEQFGSYNSTFSFSGGEEFGRYDKAQLVPFGEQWPLYEPLQGVYQQVFRLMNLPLLGATLPGRDGAALPTQIGAAAAFICYESVFPAIVRNLVSTGGTYLVLTTNDAWFAMGNGARQHYDMGRLRAIETRRWLLRAGNDGITGVVNPAGKTIAELPRGEAAWLAVTFYERTDVTLWVRYGSATTPILAIIVFIVGVVRRRS